MQAARSMGQALLLVACSSCAQVLGVPSDPKLVESPASQSTPAPNPEGAEWSEPFFDPTSNVLPSSEAVEAPGVRSDGVLPSEDVTGIDGMEGTDATSELDAVAPPAGSVDAGAPDAPTGGPSLECNGRFERVPLDLVFIVDNSGSMRDETANFEQALPSFVAQLDGDDVDYRIILLSRHRRDDRSASDEASTSVCIAAPLSGLAACPDDRPVLGPRFFHYSIKIDADDSFSQVLQAFAVPDPFALTAIGWSEWLRAGARTVFIEITDADSALGASGFVTALQAAAPEFFGTDPARPNFVFHAITGVVQRSFALDIYLAEEPIEPRVCEGTGSNPDNAGVVYQELSRATGGLRLSVCPAAALESRLGALATDVTLRSFQECRDSD